MMVLIGIYDNQLINHFNVSLHSSDSNTDKSGDAGVLINTETLKKSLIIVSFQNEKLLVGILKLLSSLIITGEWNLRSA